MLKRRIATALAALAVLGFVGACGGGDDDSSDSGSGNGQEETEDVMDEAVLEYAQCMRENGVEEYPDPDVNDDGGTFISGPDELEDLGITVSEFEAADEKCGTILEEAEEEAKANQPDLSPEEIAEREDDALVMAQCMRDKGHEFPDPKVDGNGGIAIEAPEGGKPGDPGFEEFEADLEACNEGAGLGKPGEGEAHQETGEGGQES